MIFCVTLFAEPKHLRSTGLPLVTFFFYVVFDVLRATPTQERSADVLGRCVLFYLFNRMGHA